MSEVAATGAGASGERALLVRRGLRLEYLTVGWNLVEGLVAVAAALAAGSVALLGFGIDSFVESASGSVLIWRLLAERRAADQEAVERLERRAQRLVAVSLFALAAWIAADASLARRGLLCRLTWQKCRLTRSRCGAPGVAGRRPARPPPLWSASR